MYVATKLKYAPYSLLLVVPLCCLNLVENVAQNIFTSKIVALV